MVATEKKTTEKKTSIPKPIPRWFTAEGNESWSNLGESYQLRTPSPEGATTTPVLLCKIGEFAITLRGNEGGALSTVESVRHGTEHHVFSIDHKSNRINFDGPNLLYASSVLHNAAVMSEFADADWDVIGTC